MCNCNHVNLLIVLIFGLLLGLLLGFSLSQHFRSDLEPIRISKCNRFPRRNATSSSDESSTSSGSSADDMMHNIPVGKQTRPEPVAPAVLIPEKKRFPGHAAGSVRWRAPQNEHQPQQSQKEDESSSSPAVGHRHNEKGGHRKDKKHNVRSRLGL